MLFRNAVQADEEETNFRMRTYRVKLLNSQYTKSPNIPVLLLLLLLWHYNCITHALTVLFFLANGSPPRFTEKITGNIRKINSIVILLLHNFHFDAAFA